MERAYDVLCLGLANINLMIRPVDAGVFSRDLTLVEPIEIVLGGDAMNEAIVFAALGNRTAILTRIGDDEAGGLFLSIAGRTKVDLSHVRVAPGERTAACAVMINEDGSRNFAAHRGALNRLCADDIDPGLFSRARLLSVGSLFALRDLDGPGMERVLRQARAGGAITCADMMADARGLGFAGVSGALALLDYVMPSFEEAVHLTGERDPDRIADILLAAGCGAVVLKLGADGCFVKSAGGRRFFSPAYRVRAIDTTGAGDNFVAAFQTGVLSGWPLERCARFANAAGALNVGAVGPNGAIHSMAQVLDFMERAPVGRGEETEA